MTGRYLTPAEKAEHMAYWRKQQAKTPPPDDEGGKGWPDPEMFMWCDMINGLPGICTVQSCCGHRLRRGSILSGHLWLRMSPAVSAAFDKWAPRLADHPNIEQVAKIYGRWGGEVGEILFRGHGHGHQQFHLSVNVIIIFVTSIAAEAEREWLAP